MPWTILRVGEPSDVLSSHKYLKNKTGTHSLPRLPPGIEIRTPSPAMQHRVLRKVFNIVYAEMPVSKENQDSICAWEESNLLSLYADIYPVPWRQLEEMIYECRKNYTFQFSQSGGSTSN